MDLRPVLYIIGFLLLILALGMAVPMLADLYIGNRDWRVFFSCMIVTGFFGGAMILSNKGWHGELGIRTTFLLTVLIFVTLPAFSAIPFYFSELRLSYTDAFFEAISGVTTTGATVITRLDNLPRGILLWRAILQWFGGIGVIIMALTILPLLNVGGMGLFKSEPVEADKALPRAAQTANSIIAIYVILTIICTICYMLTGMSTFDALIHAMTTISTGGFSTHDKSIAYYDTFSTEFVAMVFMVMGSLPFVLYLRAARGNLRPLVKNAQVHWFFGFVICSVFFSAFYLYTQHNMPLIESLRHASFNVISLMTGTGYANGDYNLWGGFTITLFLFLMAVGGCAGSTSCGIKIFRFQILYAITVVQLKKLLHPNGVFIPHYNNKPIPMDVNISVMSFFFMYAVCFMTITIALSLVGLDVMTSISGAMASISNVGPGFGDIIGPLGTYESLPDSAKWILSAGMLLGRLEIFSVLALFSPYFWKK